VFFFLAGCGTLRVDIDYGNTPIPSSTNTIRISTPTPTRSATPSSTVTQTPNESTSPSPTVSQSGIVAIAAGWNHTCAVTEGGAVKCWGANDHGQLGNGTMVNSDVPVDVIGLKDIKAIMAGWEHTCALTNVGAVKCWGYNGNGELGNGTTVDNNIPVDVTGLSAGVAAIDAGDDHTCAVITGSRLKCWGYNGYGQLGDETKFSRSVPIESPWFGGGVADVAAGWGHTCVRTTEGWAKCWGNNEYGQLGIGKLTDIHLPATDVVNLNGRVLQVTADGGQTCALTAGGGVQCWGNNKYGQLGDGTNRMQNAPVQVTGLTTGVSEVEVGWNHTCAVVSGGVLDCWGWNYYGQLGDGTKITRSKPVRVLWLTDGIRDVALGWAHTCVATDLGAVKCWGENNFGQLGDGTQSDSGIPLAVVGLGS
jgi:alpha-tubulin suppressor-like RCC1 family protein